MNMKQPVFHLARLVLEADTAHGIHSGRGDATHDVLLVRDANGLPAIPGSSLAGVLRHAYARRHGEAAAGQLFGTLEDEGRPSRLHVDWGLVHDASDTAHEGLLGADALDNDALLAFLARDKPLVRQRVRLEHTGAAADTGKFDTTLIPAGVRYTHWIGCWDSGGEGAEREWQNLLEQMAAGPLYLGHGTHSGNGRFRVHQLEAASWDLRTSEGREGYCSRPRLRRDNHGLQACRPTGTESGALTAHIPLQAESAWRIGGGEYSLGSHDKDIDLVPQHEVRIQWSGGRAHLRDAAHLVPGSAIKGALRHRVAFHWRRLAQEWAGDTLTDTDECPAVQQLFGSAADDSGVAGLVRISDLHLDGAKTGVMMHNRIDRYTGGVIKGGLFSEEVLWRTPLDLTLSVDAWRPVDAQSRQALELALADLCAGRLPLGASGSRGLGGFATPQGQAVSWSDDGRWLRGEDVSAKEAHA